VLAQYVAHFERTKLREALYEVLAVSRLGNQYLQANKGWELIKTNKARCATVYAVASNLVYLLATIAQPFMPQTTDKILAQLQLPVGSLEGDLATSFDVRAIPAAHKLGTVDTLFRKITDDEIKALKARFGPHDAPTATSSSSSDPAAAAAGGKKKGAAAAPAAGKKPAKGAAPPFPFDLRVGHIATAAPHPDSDKLYVLSVDLGEATPRTIVAGLRHFYTVEQLIGRDVLVLANLAPADLAGVTSQGMCLAASWGAGTDELVLVAPPTGAAPGTQVIAQGAEAAVRDVVTRKDISKIKLKVVENHAAVFSHGGKSFPLVSAGDNPVPATAPNAPVNASIK